MNTKFFDQHKKSNTVIPRISALALRLQDETYSREALSRGGAYLKNRFESDLKIECVFKLSMLS